MLTRLHAAPRSLKSVLLTGVPVRLIPSDILGESNRGDLETVQRDVSELRLSAA
jgi:hypothetical protein